MAYAIFDVILNPLMLEFVLGVILFYIYRSSFLPYNSLALVFLGSAMILCLLAANDPFVREVIGGRFFRPATYGMFSFWLVYLLLLLEGRFKPHKILLYLGDASYSIYLTHWTVLTLGAVFMPKEWPFSVYVITSVFLSILASILVYELVEKKLNNYSKRVVKKIDSLIY